MRGINSFGEGSFKEGVGFRVKCRKCGRRDAVEDGLCNHCKYDGVLDVLKWK